MFDRITVLTNPLRSLARQIATAAARWHVPLIVVAAPAQGGFIGSNLIGAK